MARIKISFSILIFLLLALFAHSHTVLSKSETRTKSSRSPIEIAQDIGSLVYADFETVKDKRAFSNRGGLVQLFAYQENASGSSKFKGAEPAGSSAPEVVKLGKEGSNSAIAFKYQLQAPNQYAGVGVEIHGQADKDGKSAADDVSGYKFLMIQLYVIGASSITVEFISRGHGIDLQGGYPQMAFKLSPGLNTYKVPLESVKQPAWATVKKKTQEILKRLTAVNVIVSCNQCVPTEGEVVIDNLIFQQ